MKRSTVLLVALLAVAGWAKKPELRDQAIQQLIAAENAFAHMSVEQGIRASFLANFADDGINFTPHPQKTRATLSAAPPPAQKPPVTLDWHPVKTDAAKSGELGYNTGPFTFTDNSPQNRPTVFGQFFSVWKRQADGAWRVVLDFGVQTPQPPGDEKPTIVRASAFKAKGPFDLATEVENLKKIERALSDRASKDGLAATFERFLDADALLLRDGMLPLTSSEKILEHLKAVQAKGTTSWQVTFAEVAQSADLGYTYGPYAINAASGPIVNGYFTRVWKRDAKGNWKVVLDVANAVPPEKTK